LFTIPSLLQPLFALAEKPVSAFVIGHQAEHLGPDATPLLRRQRPPVLVYPSRILVHGENGRRELALVDKGTFEAICADSLPLLGKAKGGGVPRVVVA
jgi:hypothetical protein